MALHHTTRPQLQRHRSNATEAVDCNCSNPWTAPIGPTGLGWIGPTRLGRPPKLDSPPRLDSSPVPALVDRSPRASTRGSVQLDSPPVPALVARSHWTGKEERETGLSDTSWVWVGGGRGGGGGLRVPAASLAPFSPHLELEREGGRERERERERERDRGGGEKRD